ncbi:DUF2017 family protein [Microbacterium sp.]|uniref:DUF2017 family protein n=1 Tax=Microbacterium sp. TaxID=51671 RepID=UPI002D77EDBA|nr:DUF2017 family protein [Microbacterium sp.]HET6301672.1 DUF2017 family protein [Microbacterium sp.]
MTPDRTVVLELTRLEALHLAGLVRQFDELLDSTEQAADDPAVARLVPDAYEEDPDAAREFRAVTESDLLSRRRSDAAAVIESLRPAIDDPHPLEEGEEGDLVDETGDLTDTVTIPLDPETVNAWLRALAAIRLVLASRLGIRSEDDHDDEDPRFGVYDWLGYRLDGLVRAVSGD